MQTYFCTMCAASLPMAPNNPCILKYVYGSRSGSVKSLLISHYIRVMWSAGSWWLPRISYILIATSEFENCSSSLSREWLHINFNSVHDIRYDIVCHLPTITYLLYLWSGDLGKQWMWEHSLVDLKQLLGKIIAWGIEDT